MNGKLLILKPSPAANYARQLGCSFFRFIASMNPDNFFEEIIVLEFGDKDEIVTEGSVKLIFIKDKPRVLRTFFKLIKIIQTINKEDVSVIKATDVSWASFLGVLAKFITRKPLLVCVNNPLYLRRKHRSKKKFNKFLDAFYEITSLKYADTIKVIVNPLKDELINRYKVDEKKIEIISACGIDNGIDTEKFRKRDEEEIFELKQRFGLSDDKRTILCIARFAEQKNLFVLLNAFKSLVEEGFESKLLLLGEGILRADIERFVESSGLMDSVIMPGFLSNDLLPSLYKVCDVFVLPSIFEGLGTVLIEAMAAGAPVVTSDIPYTKDVVSCGDNALCFKVDDPQDLKSKIIKICEDSELRERLVKNGLESCKKFSVTVIREIEKNIYKNMIAQGKK